VAWKAGEPWNLTRLPPQPPASSSEEEGEMEEDPDTE
jgi:hypothetical protein